MPYLTLDDIKLYYEIHGEGETLLFIHGLGASHQDWEYQLPFFKNNYRVILFDLRGHGKSDKPNAPYTIKQFANDISQLITTCAPRGAHIIGHSLGGMIAFQLAIDFPKLVISLTIINSAPAVIFPDLSSRCFFYSRFLIVKLFGLKYLSKLLVNKAFPKPEQAALREKFISRGSQNSPIAYLNTLRAFFGWNVIAHLSHIHCPTLIIASDADYTSPAYKQAYTKLLPNARLVIIHDSRHITIVDQADVFNKTLQEFILNQTN